MTNIPEELSTWHTGTSHYMFWPNATQRPYKNYQIHTELLIQVGSGPGWAEPHPLAHPHPRSRLHRPKVRSASEWPIGSLSPGHCVKKWGDSS